MRNGAVYYRCEEREAGGTPDTPCLLRWLRGVVVIGVVLALRAQDALDEDADSDDRRGYRQCGSHEDKSIHQASPCFVRWATRQPKPARIRCRVALDLATTFIPAKLPH